MADNITQEMVDSWPRTTESGVKEIGTEHWRQPQCSSEQTIQGT